MPKYKHIFADMDGTITESKQKISKEMKDVLTKLDNVVVISGASREQMEFQLDGLTCSIMAQSGNDTYLWKNILTEDETIEIHKHASQVSVLKKDMLDHRGCQISLSFVGHNAPLRFKMVLDPTRKIRKEILKKYPFKSKTLTCRIAGTTCFDYTRKDGTKGKNIARWIKEHKLKKKDCIYFGDALFKGGNDETVKGVIHSVQVASPGSLMVKLKQYAI